MLAPSPKPSLLKRLLGSVLPRPPAPRPFSEMGVGGTAVYGGYVQLRERSSKWIGAQRYTTIADMVVNCSIVAAGVHHFTNLVARPSWTIRPANDLSDSAKRAAELVDRAIHDLEQPWSSVVRRISTYRFYGFSIQEWTARRAADGSVMLASVESRPQSTINRWSIAADGSIEGVWQIDPQSGRELGIPRSKIIYLVDSALSDSPEGIGLFRHLAEPWERLRTYYELEARAFERDLRGTPIGRVPYTLLREHVAEGRLTAEEARNITEAIETFVKLQIRQSDTAITLDSIPYYSQAADGAKVTGTPQFGIELLQGGAAGMNEVAAAIIRTQTEMARVMAMEHLMLGESSGNRALSEDKSRHLYLVANSVLSEIAAAVEHDLIAPLCALNGIAEEDYPRAEVEDVSFVSADQVSAVLARMAQAGAVLAPDDPVIKDVRSLLGVSAPAKVPPELTGLDVAGNEPSGEELPPNEPPIAR